MADGAPTRGSLADCLGRTECRGESSLSPPLPTPAPSSSSSSSSPSSSSHPLAAAVVPLLSGFDSLIPAIKHMVWNYIGAKAERGQLALAGFIPREQEGHLVLSYERTGIMPLSASRIPPIGREPSALIPTNTMSFCTENPDAAITAVNSQWISLNPWRLTVLTVRLGLASFTSDIRNILCIINGIKATLGHVKTLIVVVDRLSFFFTSYLSADSFPVTVPIDVCESNSAFFFGILRCMMYIDFLNEETFCNIVLESFRNTGAFISPLTGVIIELRDGETWDWYSRTMDAEGPADPRMHLMVSIEEVDEATRSAFWETPVKRDSLRWLSYFLYKVKNYGWHHVTDDRPMDFSGCTRLVELSVSGDFPRLPRISLPIAVDRLEKLWLDLIDYVGPSIFPSVGLVYPHLRHLCLPRRNMRPKVAHAAGAGAGDAAAAEAPVARITVLPISSDQFPSLQVFRLIDRIIDPIHDAILDLSNFRTPGLSLNLAFSVGTIRMPDTGIQLGTLTLDERSITRICLFEDIIHRFSSLDLTSHLVSDILRVFDRVNRRPLDTNTHPASTHLKKLVIRKVVSLSLRFGAFPELQSLTLESSTAPLDGASLPQLEELILDNSESLLLGSFNSLRSLDIVGMTIPKHFSINASLLEKLSIVHSLGVNNISIDRKKYPNLQLITILPLFKHIRSPSFASSLYPRITPYSASENTKLLTLIYDERIPDVVVAKLKRDLGNVLLSPIQRVGEPLVELLPEE